jgi:hypothetical protein
MLSLDPGLARLYEAMPFLFKPPLLDLPSFLCHAGVLAITFFSFLMLLLTI